MSSTSLPILSPADKVWFAEAGAVAGTGGVEVEVEVEVGSTVAGHHRFLTVDTAYQAVLFTPVACFIRKTPIFIFNAIDVV